MLITRRVSFRAMAVMAGTILLASAGSARAGVSGVLSGGTWHNAVEVPGTASHVEASIQSVSCSSSGNCGAGGSYLDRSRHFQAFVITERAGRWNRAIEVPGTAQINKGGLGQTGVVSCPAPGSCGAVGQYGPHVLRFEMFVASEVAGRWGRAVAVPGNPGIADGGIMALNSLSCPSARNCVAGGEYPYQNTTHGHHAFVVSESNGRWGPLLPLSGAGIRAGYFSDVEAISCSSPGNCTASGTVRTVTSPSDMYAVSEQAGKWGQAVTIPQSPTLTALNVGPSIDSMSCASLAAASPGSGPFMADAAVTGRRISVIGPQIRFFSWMANTTPAFVETRYPPVVRQLLVVWHQSAVKYAVLSGLRAMIRGNARALPHRPFFSVTANGPPPLEPV